MGWRLNNEFQASEALALDSARVSEREPPFFERMASAFIDEPTMWPVLAVVTLTVSTLLAALVVLAIQDRSLSAMAALAGVAFLAVEGARAARRRGRLAVVGGLIGTVVALAGAASVAYLRLAT